MTIGMNGRFQINPLKIPTGFESIPISDGLTDGFLSVDPVMPDPACDYFPGFGDFMPAPNSRERTVGDAIRGLQHNGTRAALAKKFLHVIRHIMKIILRPTCF